MDHFDVSIPSDPVLFWGSFFPITITAQNSENLPVGDNVGQIDIISDKGTLVLLDNEEEVSSINMTQNPTTVQVYLRDPLDEDSSTVTLAVELISDRAKQGSGTAVFENAVSTDGELDFLVAQQETSTGLVKTVFNSAAPDDTAHVYTNALATYSLCS